MNFIVILEKLVRDFPSLRDMTIKQFLDISYAFEYYDSVKNCPDIIADKDLFVSFEEHVKESLPWYNGGINE